GENCKHVYAVMKTLLAEHTRGSVQALSAKQITTPAKRSAGSGEPFEEQVKAANGGQLTNGAENFLRKLQAIYTRCGESRGITAWDFQELGLPLGNSGWQELRVWPSFPKTLRQFWLYIAHAATQRGCVLPEFMVPVTDF